MTAFDRTVARVNEIADRDVPDREKVGDYLVAILDTQIAELIRSGSLRESGYTEIADLLGQPSGLRQLIVDLTDEDPCEFDHHGYCQAHGWMATEPRCPHARAKELLSAPEATTAPR